MMVRPWLRPSAALVAALGFAGLGLADAARAQVEATNLLEARAGHNPFDAGQPANLTSLYDQLDLVAAVAGGRVGVRFETERNSAQQSDYEAITQRFAEWTDPRLRVRVGTLTTILGRGLLHRSFEVAGVALDPPGPDTRFAFARDVDGALVEWTLGRLEGRAFGGAPSDATQSPAVEADGGPARRRGHLAGGQLALQPRPGTGLGAAYARFSIDDFAGTRDQELGSGFVELDPFAIFGLDAASLPLYAEYAQAGGEFGDWFRFRTGDDTPHALYASLNLLWKALALSAEVKDYSEFRFGTNDPPSLVREHGFVLLNRGTHVLNATREQGFQLESSVRVAGWGSLTGNMSRADGRFGARAVRFEEFYAEAHLADPRRLPGELTLFVDRAKDEFTFLDRRTVLGVAGSARVRGPWSLTADVEFLSARRRPTIEIHERALTFGVSLADRGSVAATWERTSDPIEEDPDRPGEARGFLSASATLRLSARHDATLLAGERRGGLACTAGTCYEVPAFRGVELRLTSRL